MEHVLTKISRRSRWLWNDLWYQSLPSSYWKKQRGQSIFIYHGLDYKGSRQYNSRFVSSRYFEKQLVFFKKHFCVVSLEDYINGNYPEDDFVITLTFDDGYLNNLNIALPLLEKYQVPATFFVTSIRSAGYDILWSDHLDMGLRLSSDQINVGERRFEKVNRQFIDTVTGQSLKNACREEDFDFKLAMMNAVSDEFMKDERLGTYWRLMNEEDLKTLNRSPIATVASHGHFHNNYSNISTQETIDDLRSSKSYLEEVLQEEVNWLAYPDGSYNSHVIELAEEAGFKRQFAVEYIEDQHESDVRVWPRFGLNPYIKLHHQAKAIVNGKY